MGEMSLYFGLADVALLGGSFTSLGGQNLIEATACGCPVIMGPHTFNFAEAALTAEAAGAAFRVKDMQAGLARALALLSEPAALQQAKSAALAFGASHGGAAERTVQALNQLAAVPRA
jgi:3-deoxy-D-manno-octulosonic-acid transferase